MSAIAIPNTFTPGTTARSSQVNANFTAVTAVVNGNLDNTNLISGAIGATGGSDLNSHIVDNSTLFLGSNQLSVKSGGVTSTQLGTGASLANIGKGNLTFVTRAVRGVKTDGTDPGVGGYCRSTVATNASFGLTSIQTQFTTSCTLSSAGGPVRVGLCGGAGAAYITGYVGTAIAEIQLINATTSATVASLYWGIELNTANNYIPLPAISGVDTAPSGTPSATVANEYYATIGLTSTTTATISFANLCCEAYEI